MHSSLLLHMHYDSVPNCLFNLLFSHRSQPYSVIWWAFSLWWSRVISWGRLLSVEASLATEIGRVQSVQQENGRKDDYNEGSWALEDWVSCHAIQANSVLCLMISWVFLILRITDLKLSDLICCVTEHSQMLFYWTWKSSTYCYLFWQNGSQYLKLSLQQQLQTLCTWCLSFSLFL